MVEHVRHSKVWNRNAIVALDARNQNWSLVRGQHAKLAKADTQVQHVREFKIEKLFARHQMILNFRYINVLVRAKVCQWVGQGSNYCSIRLKCSPWSASVHPLSRKKCINYCKANRKVSQFFQKYDIENKNMISMIIPTPGPKQSDITVREVGEWSSCFLDDQQTCGTGRKYRTKACLSLDGSPLPLSFCQESETKFLQVCSIECKSLTVSASSWTLWSPCSRSCGNGVQTRFIRSAGIHSCDLIINYVLRRAKWILVVLNMERNGKSGPVQRRVHFISGHLAVGVNANWTAVTAAKVILSAYN